MINHRTILELRARVPKLKGFVLDRSPGVGQAILMVFILTVMYMALRPCDCPDAGQGAFEVDSAATSLTPGAPRQEHPIVEEGGDEPLLDRVSTASRQFWRWSEVRSGASSIHHDSLGTAYSLEVVELEGHAPGLFIREHGHAQVREQAIADHVFHGREMDTFQRDHDAPLDMRFAVEGDVVYLAYFPKEKGMGVEVYAVDLIHESPIWRTTVRPLDPGADLLTDVQLFVRDGRLQIMTREGELRRIDELSMQTGEILSMQEIDAAWTEFPVQESMHDTFYTRCVFQVDEQGAEERPDCVQATPNPTLNKRRRDVATSIVRRHSPSDTVYWRLNPIGRQFTFFPLAKLWPEPPSDILLSHSPGQSTSVLIALDHDSGDVLWSAALDPAEFCQKTRSCQPLTHHLLKVDVTTIGSHPALVVYGEENEEVYTAYIDPRTGEIRAMIRAPRVE